MKKINKLPNLLNISKMINQYNKKLNNKGYLYILNVLEHCNVIVKNKKTMFRRKKHITVVTLNKEQYIKYNIKKNIEMLYKYKIYNIKKYRSISYKNIIKS